MTSKDFEELKDYILKENNYFSYGYANVFKEPITNRILVKDGGEYIDVFPDDTQGNYFYLRIEPNINFTQLPRITDGRGGTPYSDRATVYIVAMVQEADVFTLINNLRSTVLKYKPLEIEPTSAMWLGENVIVNEMSGFDDEIVLDTLKNLKDETIIRLTLTVSKQFVPSKCIEDPCKCC